MEERILFTSESVSEGHPDKVCDQIADAILDAVLKDDKDSFVACECFATRNLVLIGGEITTNANVDYEKIVRDVIKDIGYNDDKLGFNYKNVKIINTIQSQSLDIRQGVVKEDPLLSGAGDQGIMFGYATNESEGYMPLPICIAHKLVRIATQLRKEGKFKWARPDMKSEVTIDYTDEKPRIKTILMSCQHDEDYNEKAFKEFIKEEIMKKVALSFNLNTDFEVLINPTGRFVIGGPAGDTGLTGRKIIVDTYGGSARHGGGAFSGKDPSKVDRSAAYYARYIAKNLVAAGVASEVLVQIAYAIGVAEPVSIFINTRGTCKIGKSDGEIARAVGEIFDLRPAKIIEKFGLTNPIFEVTAAYGHMGREPYTSTVEVTENGIRVKKEVKFFGWEETDAVELIKKRIIS